MTPQELKESILWNAIQGKFTTQDPRESVSGALGKTQITPVAEEDAYFEIPGNWCWARIGEIFDLVNGKAFKPTDWSESGIPIVRIQNLNDPNAPYNCFSGEIEEKFILHGGELLFSWSGTPGTSFGAFIWNGGHAVLNQHIFIVYPKIKLDYEYAKYALNGELRIFIAKAHGGAGLKHITRKEFDSCFLPIPPLAEQKRIVAKIEELLPLIERYEKAWSRLEDFNKCFPGDMQKSILQMAIQGKLVEQRPEEGTGEELYRQIQAEKQALIKAGKIKKEKPFSTNASFRDYPFDIPDTWFFVRFGELMISRDSERIPVSTDERAHRGKVYDYYGASGVIDKIDDYLFDKELLLIGEDGANLLARSTPIAFLARGKYWVNNHAHVLDGCAGLNLEYICYYINAISLAPYVTGTAQPKMNQENMNAIWVPLPPLAEQKRIIARLEELLPLCERLR